MYYLYGQNTTNIYIHTEQYIGYTTTCFGPLYWQSSGCTIWSEYNYIYSHRIVHWVYNYMFRPTHILYTCLLSLQYNLTMANIQDRNMQLYTQCTLLRENIQLCSDHIGNTYFLIIQNVPLATDPGISLIILTPMKILQRNLNRSTFVV